MNKVVIFNVGSAFSSYLEFEGNKILVDVGGGNDFSPVKDFLLPLAQVRNFPKSRDGKYSIDQIFMSHLDNDHISDYLNFEEHFTPKFITIPNDNDKQNPKYKVNRTLINENQVAKHLLDKIKTLHPGRKVGDPNGYENPLVVFDTNHMILSYITPAECEQIDRDSEEKYPHYSNNTSLVLYVRIGEHSILFTGDIMEDGMRYLIENNDIFRSTINELGVDFLIAPHHGLDTSFPTPLFEQINGGKVKLNIISEKVIKKSKSDSRHDVDGRYYSPEFSEGYDVLNGALGSQYGIITSRGHIVIDFDGESPLVKRCNSNEDLLKEFM